MKRNSHLDFVGRRQEEEQGQCIIHRASESERGGRNLATAFNEWLLLRVHYPLHNIREIVCLDRTCLLTTVK